MASLTFKKLKEVIRIRKEGIENDLESRHFNSFIAPTELMCTTWFIRGQLDIMHNALHEIYWDNDTDLTRREYEALYKYVDSLDNYYWDLLYDKGCDIRNMITERR